MLLDYIFSLKFLQLIYITFKWKIIEVTFSWKKIVIFFPQGKCYVAI